MDRIRIAVVGTSAIADDLIGVLNESSGAVYVGSMSRSAERARSITQRHGGSRPFTSIEEVAAAPEVDAVYIASPNALHAAQALACIEAGKHVLVEKPLAPNERLARALFAAGEARGVTVMEAMRSVHDPAYGVIREAMSQIGRVRRATLRLGKRSSRYDEVLSGRQTNIFDCRMASGALMDIGVYCVETMVALFGAPQRVLAAPVLISDASCEATGGAIDGAGSVLAVYPDFVVELAYSKISQDTLACQIEGEAGTIVYEGVSVPTGGELLLMEERCGQTGYSPAGAQGCVRRALPISPASNNMCHELEDFVSCIAGEASPEPFRDITLASLAVMDEVRRQAGISFPADEGRL